MDVCGLYFLVVAALLYLHIGTNQPLQSFIYVEELHFVSFGFINPAFLGPLQNAV